MEEKGSSKKKLENKREADVMDKMMLVPSRNSLQYFSQQFSRRKMTVGKAGGVIAGKN